MTRRTANDTGSQAPPGWLPLRVFGPGRPVASNRLVGFLVALGSALATLAICWARAVNHDIAWYLIATQRWLTGGVLYVDVVEVNPPLVFYLTAPAVAISKVLGSSLQNGFHIAFASLVFCSNQLTWSVFTRDRIVSRCRAAALVWAIWAIVLASGPQDIGQRDQLLVLFTLPWLVGQSVPQGRGRRIGLALFAAIGICLKPYFLALPLFVTIWRVLRARSWRPVFAASNGVFLATGAAYVAYVRIVHPAYFDEIVPIGRLVYGAYTLGTGTILEQLIPDLVMRDSCGVASPFVS